MKKLLMIISLLLLVYTAGCSKQQAADVPASPAADVAYSVTDDAGRTLHFEHKPRRIVSLTYGTDEILTDLVDIKRIMYYTLWEEAVGQATAKSALLPRSRPIL